MWMHCLYREGWVSKRSRFELGLACLGSKEGTRIGEEGALQGRAVASRCSLFCKFVKVGGTKRERVRESGREKREGKKEGEKNRPGSRGRKEKKGGKSGLHAEKSNQPLKRRRLD